MHACVCVYILRPWRLLPTARFLRHTREVRFNNLVLWIFICQIPSSLYLKMSYSTSKDETPARQKITYVDIGYKSVTSLNQQVNEKILRYAGYSKLNSSTLNQVLGSIIKKICLFWSNVAASLRRALLVDAMGWNLLVR